jgi:hypothetical protein
MRLTQILPWTTTAVSPVKKDERTPHKKRDDQDGGLSGAQIQPAAKPQDPPDDPPPSDHLDIKV